MSIYDGAPCHSEMTLSIPDNMMTETLPAHCPELNPTEHIWDEVREKFFPNLVFDSMAAVERKLIEAILFWNVAQRSYSQSLASSGSLVS